MGEDDEDKNEDDEKDEDDDGEDEVAKRTKKPTMEKGTTKTKNRLNTTKKNERKNRP